MVLDRFSTACRRLMTGGLLLAAGLASAAWWRLEETPSTTGERAAARTEWPSAEALLRGVAASRTRYQSLHAEVTIDEPLPRPHRTTLVVDIAENGRLRRFERLADDGSQGEVVIVDDDELRGFKRRPSEELCLDDAATALGRYDGLICEPRLLGLTARQSATGSLDEYLGQGAAQPPVVLGQEELEGNVVWRVQTADDGLVSTLWIEDSTFRVHKRLDRSEDGCCEIRSYFDGDKTCPLPSRVQVLTVPSGQDVCQKSLAVRNLVLDETFPAQRFALSSLNLPINTPVVDHRLGRRIGYWNGQELQD